jgi:hypothetical protein
MVRNGISPTALTLRRFDALICMNVLLPLHMSMLGSGPSRPSPTVVSTSAVSGKADMVARGQHELVPRDLSSCA